MPDRAWRTRNIDKVSGFRDVELVVAVYAESMRTASIIPSACQQGVNAGIEPGIHRVSLSIDHRPLRLCLWNGQPARLSRSGVMRSSTMSQWRVAVELASRGSATLGWITLRVLFPCLRAFRRQRRITSGADGGSRERKRGKPICFRRPARELRL